VRPDYQAEKHGSIVQAGFNLISIADEPLNPVEQAEVQNQAVASEVASTTDQASATLTE